MAYNAQQLSINWLFDVPSVGEVAVTGLSFSGGASWTGAVAAVNQLDEADCQLLIEAMASLMNTAELQWADYSRLYGVKVAPVGTNGLYLPGGLAEVEATEPFAGDSQQILPQSTCVLSLRTVTTVGKGNYGRMYLPHTKLGQPVGQAVSNSTITTAVAVAGAEFVGACNVIMNNAISDSVLPVIMGQTGSGTQKTITNVAVDSVTDTQRRRTNGIPNIYSFADVELV